MKHVSSGHVYCEYEKRLPQAYKDPHIWDQVSRLTISVRSTFEFPPPSSRRTADGNIDVEILKLGKDIARRIKYSIRHTSAGTLLSITEGWRTRCVATAEDFCHELNQLGSTDGTYTATHLEREGCNKMWVFAQANSGNDGNSTAARSRTDCAKMRAAFRKTQDGVAANETNYAIHVPLDQQWQQRQRLQQPQQQLQQWQGLWSSNSLHDQSSSSWQAWNSS